MFTGSDITYIYNDYRTVIHGYFQNGYLVEGQASKIIACRCTEGMWPMSSLHERIQKKFDMQFWIFDFLKYISNCKLNMMSCYRYLTNQNFTEKNERRRLQVWSNIFKYAQTENINGSIRKKSTLRWSIKGTRPMFSLHEWNQNIFELTETYSTCNFEFFQIKAKFFTLLFLLSNEM